MPYNILTLDPPPSSSLFNINVFYSERIYKHQNFELYSLDLRKIVYLGQKVKKQDKYIFYFNLVSLVYNSKSPQT